MTGRKLYSRNEKKINFIVKVVSFLPIKIRLWLLVRWRNIKGRKGVALRYILLRTCAKRCGNNVVIKEMVIIENVQNLVVGDNVSIHPFSYVEAIGGVEIGNNVSIAHSTSILSVNHTWDDASVPIKYNKVEKEKVHIEDDVWVGCGCRILAGVTLHHHCVVAAGAVVTKDVESGVIVGGIPAKVLKAI